MKKLLLLAMSCMVVLPLIAEEPEFDLSGYVAQPGLKAMVRGELLRVEWMAGPGRELAMVFMIDEGQPVIRRIALREGEAPWISLAEDVLPEFRVVSGVRRVTQQQTEPLLEMGMEMTEELLNRIKWDAFWDAPLHISDKPPLSHQSSIPAAEAFANHPGMPRKPEEVHRASASYLVKRCVVRSRGTRLEVVFPGVKAGIFEGSLQFDFYRGSALLRQMLVARTDHPSAAFKYDGGLSGLPLDRSSRLVYEDLSGQVQRLSPAQVFADDASVIKGSHRMLAAELKGGSLVAFPPPHSFYWARETEEVLGYGWYRRDTPQGFSFGIRQAEKEENPEFYDNFALYNARPGLWQRMPVFYCILPGRGEEALEAALAYTRGDRYKALEGFQVMGHHYHVGMLKRLKAVEDPEHVLNDVATMKSVGVDIFSVIDGVRGPARHDRGEAYVDELHEYYEAARSQSDDHILVLANDENSTGGRPPFLGGHYDILYSKPTYWRPSRAEGQPVVEAHPKYGTVYNVATGADMMVMCEHANALLSLPHPDTKRSTGYPVALYDSAHFQHPRYASLGYRWGMGIDASEKRLGEYRFQRLWDACNNDMASRGLPPKFALAISENRSDLGHRGRPPWDDAYGMSPVNYLRMESKATSDNYEEVLEVLRKGDYFVSSGEVLIPRFELQGKGRKRTIVAQVEWTFPLEFVEVVWGDGESTEREIIPATSSGSFGQKTFEIPFDARGKRWVRFAAWDIATNGAMVQPVEL